MKFIIVAGLLAYGAVAQKIDLITPRQGSILGGTRVSILGSGFDIRGRSNDVYIGTADGGVFCDPVPNECHTTRIVCLTPPFKANGTMPVQVSANGVVASCNYQSGNGCTFQYSADRTPTVTALVPEYITEPASITVVGTGFDRGDNTIGSFDFSAWFGDEERCDLGSNPVSSTSFVCSAENGLFPGTNPFKLQLGSRGIARVADNVGLTVMPSVDGLTIIGGEGSTEGGQTVTITGNFFSRTARENEVTIHGAPCIPTSATPQQIVCTTTAHPETTTAAPVEFEDGVQFDFWGDNIAAELSVPTLRGKLAYLNPSVSKKTTSFGGAVPAVQESRAAMRYTSWYTAPQTGEYTITAYMDDVGELWVGTDDAPVAPIRQYQSEDVSYNDRLIVYRNTYGTSSGKVSLVAGTRYWMQLFVLNADGPMGSTITFMLPDNTSVVNPTSGMTIPKAPIWKSPIVVKSRGVQAVATIPCRGYGSCNYNYKNSATPIVTSVAPLSGPAGTAITLTGSALTTAANTAKVYLGAYACPVTSASLTQIVCTVPEGLPAGTHPVRMNILSSGDARLAANFVATFSITSVDNSNSYLAISGTGLNVDPARITVLLAGSTVCTDVSVVNGQIRCAPPASLPSGTTSVEVKIADAATAVAPLGFSYDQVNVRPGTTTAPKPPVLNTKFGTLFKNSRVSMTVPQWSVGDKKLVTVLIGSLDCPVVIAQGSSIVCTSPAIFTSGSYLVTASYKGETVVLGNYTVQETVVSTSVNYLSANGGNVVEVYHSGTYQDTDLIKTGAIKMTYRGVPCKEVVRRSFTSVRCYIDDASFTAEPALPILDSFNSNTADVLQLMQVTGNVKATANGFEIPAGATLFTRRPFTKNVRFTAEITPSATQCIRMTALSSDPSAERSGMVGIATSTTAFTVARNTWQPTSVSSSKITLTPGVKNLWRLDVTNGHAALYIDEEQVAFMNSPPLNDGVIGFGASCQAITVQNLKIEDLTPRGLALEINGKALPMVDEPLIRAPSSLVLRQVPSTVQVGGNFRMTIERSVTSTIFLFPEDSTSFQVTSSTLPLCTASTGQTTDSVTGTVYSACTVANNVPAGTYIARYRESDNGFIATQTTITVTPRLTAIAPTSPSFYGARMIITGTGLGPANKNDITVTVGDADCPVTYVAVTGFIVCELAPAASESARGPFTVNVNYKGVKFGSGEITYLLPDNSPRVTTVSAANQPRGNNDYVTINGLRFGNSGAPTFVEIGGEICSVGYGANNYIACRFKGNSPQPGTYPVRYHAHGLGYAYANASEVSVTIRKGFLNVADATGSNGGAVVSVIGQHFAVDKSFATAVSADYSTASNVDAANWDIVGGTSAFATCGTMSGFGGLDNFGRYTVANRKPITGLPAHTSLSVSFEIIANGIDSIPVQVTVDGKVYSFSDVAQRPAQAEAALVGVCSDNDYRIARTFAIPHTASTASISFAVPTYYSGRGWFIRNFAVKTGSLVHAITIGSDDCPISYAEPGLITCTAPALAAGTYTLTVSEAGSALSCVDRTGTCAVTVSDDKNVAVAAATFASIPSTASKELTWSTVTRATATSGPLARIVAEGFSGTSWVASGVSQQVWYKEDGFTGITFSLAGIVMYGLSNGPTSTATSYVDIDFAFYRNGASIYFYEFGAYVGEAPTGAAESLFELRVEDDDTVSYFVDKTVVYRSSRKAQWPLRIDVSLATSGSVGQLNRINFKQGFPSAPSTRVPVVLTGANLPNANAGPAKITVNGVDALVLRQSVNYYVVAVESASAVAGASLAVTVSTTAGSFSGSLTLSPAVTALSSGKGNTNGNHLITVVGSGFTVAPTVTLGSVPCAVKSFNFNSVQCLTGASAEASLLNVSVSVSGAASKCLSTVDVADQTTVSTRCPTYNYTAPSITATSVSFTNGYVVVSGTGFPMSETVSMFVGEFRCTSTIVGDSTVSCPVPNTIAGGVYDVVLSFANAGGLPTQSATIPVTASVSIAAVGDLGGARITVTGTNFGPSGATLKNGAADVCASVETIVAGSSFVCVTAPGAFSSVVAVASSGSASGSISLVASSANAPTVTSVAPTPIVGNSVVTITGTNFNAVATISISGASCSILSQTTTTVVCRAGATPNGAVTVGIATSARGASNTIASTAVMSVAAAATAPVGARTTVLGSGFSPSATYAVSIGSDFTCADAQYVDQSTLSCLVSGPEEFVDKSFDVYVTQSLGTVTSRTSTYNHNVVVNPTLTSVNPAQGSKAGGEVLTIVGSGFDNNPQNNLVLIGGTRCMTASSSATELTCVMDPIVDGLSGEKSVTVNVRGLPSANNLTFTANLAISSVSPNNAISVEGGLPVTIVGSGFPASTAFGKMSVTVGGVDCPILSTSESAIVCNLGASPRPGQKSITELYQIYPTRDDNVAYIRVNINGTVADVDDATTKIEFSAASTPTITGAVPATSIVNQGTDITISGTGFAASGNVVELLKQGLNGARSRCVVTQESTTSIKCKADLISFGKHFVQVYVPNAGYAKSQITCPVGQFLTCDGQCLTQADCSYTEWGIFGDCPTLLSVLAGDAFCHSNGGSDRINGKFKVDTGKVLDLNCPMYGCEAGDCNTTIAIGGRGEVVSTCGVDPNGFVVETRARINSIDGPRVSSLYGGARLTISGLNLDLNSVFVIGGGAYCVPISADNIAGTVTCETVAVQSPAQQLKLVGLTKGVEADCAPGVCEGFSYSRDDAPTVTAVAPLRDTTFIQYVAGSAITITGARFSANPSDNVVMVGGQPCAVISGDSSQIVCTAASLYPGDYVVTVRVGGVSGSGLTAPIANRARVRPTITNVTSIVSTTLGGSEITLYGSGLVSAKGAAKYTYNRVCESTVIAANLTQVTYVTSACSAGWFGISSTVDNYGFECKTTTCAVTFSAPPTATAELVTPTRVQISSTAALDVDKLSLTVGNGVCTIVTSSSNTLQCDFPATHAAGEYPIVLIQKGLGRFNLNGYATAVYQGSVTSISPSVGSRGGAQSVTIVGTGFASVPAQMDVRVAGAYCDVTSATATQIICTTTAVAADVSGVVNITLKAPVGSGVLTGASYAYTSASTPTLTSVSPNRGSTAGGTMLTIVGTRLSTNIRVSINGALCTQTTAQRDATTDTAYYCTTGPLATSKNAVLTAVDLTHGRAANTLTYGYIDLWSRWTTWGNNPPPVFGDSAVISEGQTIMMDYDAPRLHLILVMGHLMFDETRDITLEATYIMINFGRFTIGTPEAPYVHNAVIRLFGDRLTPEIPVHGSKVLALRHGALDMHGIPRSPTFTKLAETAAAFSSIIKVRGPVDWKAGEEIVITTTDFKMEHSEPRFITSVANADSAVVTIGIDRPLYYRHNGQKECFDNNKICIEEIADVMLLTRNIKLVGDNRTQSIGFGGTMFLMPMGQNGTMYARLSYVEFSDVGQQYIVGRYPVHYHVTGPLNNSFVKGCSVHRSLNRAFSIHGISNNTYVDNVAYDVQGHCYFIEDGDEVHNNLTHNIAALVHVSTSNLNTDLTPAAFWCVSAKNFVVGNIAAGSAAYGFWIAPFHPYSTGPGYSPNVCPSTHTISQFENNEAHASKKYGMNIFQYFYPKQKECDFNGPDAPGVIKNFFSWKNKIHGVSVAHSEVGEIGAVTFENLVSANNGEDHEDASAFWVEHIKAPNMTFGLKNAVLIAQTSNEPHISVHTRRGINLPLGDNFFAEDVTFINYRGQNYGVEPQRWAERMSFCFPWGWEALFRRTRWVDTENKLRMRFVHHGIINDEDGSFGSGTPNTQIIPISSILDPALCPAIPGSPITPVAACTAAHKLRRFGLANVNEVFSDQLFAVDDRTEIVPQITRQYSMSVPANKVITITFQSAYNPSTFDWTANDRFRQVGEKNIFQTLYKEVRAAANATFDGVNAAMLDRRPTLQDTQNAYYFGDKVFTALLIAPTRGMTAKASTCPWEGCPIEPVEAAALGGPCTPWENANAWVNKRVPEEGAALRVNYTESICLAIPGKTYRLRSLYLGGKLEVNSTYCKKGDKITLYVEKFIHIRGGILQVGSPQSPLECEFEIIIGPVDFNNMGASTVVPFSARALVLESGDIAMYGAPKTRIAYLATTMQAKSKVLTVDRDVNWVVGDVIAIAQTRREEPFTGTHREEESEDATIVAINGRTITLDTEVKFEHFGAPAQVLNGIEYNIGAEVVCLTRHVKITGGHKKTDVLEWNMGWNFHVGCTSKILKGCGDGDARLVGFPMGSLKPGSVRMENVQMDDIGQEGSIHAALVFDGLVTSTTEVNARTSFVRGSSFNRVRAIGINIHSSTSALELSNNVLFNVDGDGIRVGGRNNILDGNIILKNSFVKPLCKKMYDATVAPDCVGGAFRLNSGNTVKNNIAASGDGAGFITIGESCDQPFAWSNNFAIRHQDGLLINDKLATGGTPEYYWEVRIPTCRVVGGVNAFSNSDQGVAIFYAEGDVFARNIVAVDNVWGITSLLLKNFYDRGDTEQQLTIEDSTFAGHWPSGQGCASNLAFKCRTTMVDSKEWCSTIYNAQMGPRIARAGIMEAVFTDNSYAGRSKGESKFMWYEPDSYGSIKGRAIIRNVRFDNFDGINNCGQREVAFFQDFFSNDTFHQHTFEGIQWGNGVKAGGEFYFWDTYGDAKGTLTEGSQTVFINYDDTKRGGFWPDAPYKVWLTDKDGSFTRSGKQSTVFGSRTIARTATFDQLKYDGLAFRNGGAPGALKPGCKYVNLWNAYQCDEKKYVSLTIESYAADALTRRSGPLVMCKGDGQVGPNGHPLCQGGEADYASGPVSKGKVQRATLDRLSRWRFTVEVGYNYTLSTRGQPPVWMRMWLHDHEHTGLALNDIGVVVNMRYFGENSRMRVGVYTNGVRRPVSFGFGFPYQLNPPQEYPKITDEAGTHYHNLGFYGESVDTKQYNIMSVTMKPNAFVDWKQEAIIIVTASVAMTEEDFFNNKATFALALASTLGITADRLKFANIVAGTNSVRRQLQATSTISVNYQVELPEASLNTNADTQPSAIPSDLDQVLARAQSIAPGTTIGGVQVASVSSEVVAPQYDVPAVSVDNEYNYILVNVTRTDGGVVNHTYLGEFIAAYTNDQIASIAPSEFTTGSVWTYYNDNKTRMTLFYALEDSVRSSNILTGKLYDILMSPTHRAQAIPSNYAIVDMGFTRQNFETYGDDGDKSLAAGFIILIVIGCLVVVALFVAAVAYVLYQRRNAFRVVPSFGDKDASHAEMKDLAGPNTKGWGGNEVNGQTHGNMYQMGAKNEETA